MRGLREVCRVGPTVLLQYKFSSERSFYTTICSGMSVQKLRRPSESCVLRAAECISSLPGKISVWFFVMRFRWNIERDGSLFVKHVRTLAKKDIDYRLQCFVFLAPS